MAERGAHVELEARERHRVDELVAHVDATNCDRVVMYLVQVASYVPEPEDGEVTTHILWKISVCLFSVVMPVALVLPCVSAPHAVASLCLPGSRTTVVLKWVHSRRYDTGELGIWYEEEGGTEMKTVITLRYNVYKFSTSFF